jgi:uncharacterized protein YecE (DUF72 family)
MQAASALGDRLGAVLLQLPPDFARDDEQLAGALANFGRRVRVAVEFRHPSWWHDDIFAILEDADAALCLTDRDSRPTSPLVRTASWCYLRMHAGRARPAPCYGDTALGSWVERLVTLFGPTVEGYVFFNNDPGACAPRDAETFRRKAARAGITVV